MSQQLIDNDAALRLFFTDEVYLISGEHIENKDKAAFESISLQAPIVAEPSQPFKKKYDFIYKGKYGKGIVILSNDTQHDVCSPAGMEVLTNLMKAIKVGKADVAVINYAHYHGATFFDLYQALQCRLVLAFGVSPDELKIPCAGLHQFTHHQQSRIIFTDNLNQLANNKPSKLLLWNTLKTLLNE